MFVSLKKLWAFLFNLKIFLHHQPPPPFLANQELIFRNITSKRYQLSLLFATWYEMPRGELWIMIINWMKLFVLRLCLSIKHCFPPRVFALSFKPQRASLMSFSSHFVFCAILFLLSTSLKFCLLETKTDSSHSS